MYKVFVLLLLTILSIANACPQTYAQQAASKKDDAITYFNRGNKFYSEGRYDKAIAEFEKALKLNPKDASSHFGLGNSYFLKKDYKKALGHYKQVVKLKPNYAKVHYAMGLAYRRLGMKEEAEREFERYNALSREELEARRQKRKPTERKVRAREEKRPKVTRIEKKPSRERPRREDRKLETRPRAAERQVAERRRAAERRPAPRPHVRTAEPRKERRVRRIEPRGRREITRQPERRPKAKKAKPRVVKRKKTRKVPEGNFITRNARALWDSSPIGKIFLGLITYTLIAQTWLGLVVLVCLIFLWRKR